MGLARTRSDQTIPIERSVDLGDDKRSYEELRPLLDAVYNHGSLVFGTDACTMYWHLIVTGPHRGHVWQIVDVRAQPLGVDFGYTTARSGFAGWVRHWVERKDWFDAAPPSPTSTNGAQ